MRIKLCLLSPFSSIPYSVIMRRCSLSLCVCQLQSSLPQVLLLVDAMSSSHQSEAQVLEVVRLLAAWLAQGVTLSSLFDEHRCDVIASLLMLMQCCV